MKQVFVLALVAALSVLALRPYCASAFAGQAQADCARLWSSAGQHAAGHPAPATDPAVECRGSIDDATPVVPVEPLAPRLPDELPAAAFFAFAGLLLFARPRNAAKFRRAVPPERPFYARSARIRR